jgi:GT2 family glycosyltransferase
VSVVLPFHGTPEEAGRALDALVAIDRTPEDELIVVDNSSAGIVPARAGVRVVPADAEHSAYYARNIGSAAATNAWLLFVDADCRPRVDILARYFDAPAADSVGALIGEVVGVGEQDALVARYARARGHLGQLAHWTFPFRPWGVTANLLVRREAWASVGGFHEGIRSAGDTEFSWRIQDAGWKLDYRPDAVVEHWHRDSVRRLARQGARYGAGRAWVMRRYPGSLPKPLLLRPVGRSVAGIVVWTATGQFERALFKALDAVFVTGEWVAFRLSNTPPVSRSAQAGTPIGLVAGAFPASDDPAAVDRARDVPGAPIEAAARPVRVDRESARGLPIRWAEDDGTLRRLAAMAWLARTRPAAVARYVTGRRTRGHPPLAEVAARARRLADVREVRPLADGAPTRDAAAIACLLELD